MARLVDRDTAIPSKEVQICCVGLPRTGTTSLYRALTILGYRTYHGFEFVKNGRRDMDLLYEALSIKHSNPKGTLSYGRAEFDKIWGHYNAVIDLPGFAFVDELLEAYPKAKFILTSRNVDAWLASVRRTVFSHMRSSALFWQSSFDYEHARPLRRLLRKWAQTFCGMDSGQRAREAYIQHMRHCIDVIPSNRLLVLNLEDKIDWKPLCEFLGCEIPDERYPAENNSASYRQVTSGMRRHGLWRPLRQVLLLSCLVGVMVVVAFEMLS